MTLFDPYKAILARAADPKNTKNLKNAKAAGDPGGGLAFGCRLGGGQAGEPALFEKDAGVVEGQAPVFEVKQARNVV